MVHDSDRKMTNEEALAFVDVLTGPSKKAREEGYKEGRKNGLFIGSGIGIAIGVIYQMIWTAIF